MRTIRKGIFETNSSSTHSIHVEEGEDGVLMDTLPLDPDGNVDLREYDNEFGWYIEEYSDPGTKAVYLWRKPITTATLSSVRIKSLMQSGLKRDAKKFFLRRMATLIISL